MQNRVRDTIFWCFNSNGENFAFWQIVLNLTVIVFSHIIHHRAYVIWVVLLIASSSTSVKGLSTTIWVQIIAARLSNSCLCCEIRRLLPWNFTRIMLTCPDIALTPAAITTHYVKFPKFRSSFFWKAVTL